MNKLTFLELRALMKEKDPQDLNSLLQILNDSGWAVEEYKLELNKDRDPTVRIYPPMQHRKPNDIFRQYEDFGTSEISKDMYIRAREFT